MGPAQDYPSDMNNPIDPLAPPRFNGEGNPMLWARRVAKWVRAQEALCEASHKRGYPKSVQGYVLAQALYGTARRTVESTLTDDVINSESGVSEIVHLLVKFNPTTHAHEIFTSFKNLMKIRRRNKESFKLYVNRFEAAASELRNLTPQDKHGEAEQLLAFQLLEGAQIPTAVFMQVLSNCIAEPMEKVPKHEKIKDVKDKLKKITEDYKEFESEELAAALSGTTRGVSNQVMSILKAAMDALVEDLQSLTTTLEEELGTSEAKVSDFVTDDHVVTIDFENAKKTLRGLDAVSTQPGPSAPEAHDASSLDRNTVERLVRQTLLSQQRKSDEKLRYAGGATPGAAKMRAQKRKEKLAKRKAISNCKTCGKKGHWAGDIECQGRNGSTLAGSCDDGTRSTPVKSLDEDSFFQ